MKTYTTAIYTLTALAVQDWALQAAANPMPEPLPNSPDTDTVKKDLGHSLNEAAYRVESVALPESMLEPSGSSIEFDPIARTTAAEEVEEGTNEETDLVEPVMASAAALQGPIAPQPDTTGTTASVTATDLSVPSTRYGLTALSIASPPTSTPMPEFANQRPVPQPIAQQRIAQQETLPDAPPITVPDPAVLNEAQTELDRIEELAGVEDPADRSAPALTISNPSGFGVDRNTVFVSGTFQERTRYSNRSDGALGIGIGLGDSREAVGVELSYTIGSFGRNRGFGTGGFNAKVHRRFSESFSAAIGWNGFIITGEEDGDFEDSVYGSMTKIFRLRDDLDAPFSRLAVTAGAGTGQFRLEDDVEDDDFAVNPFGSLALRVVEPVSVITEWTGQDLAVGVSVNPFRNRNIVITPAVRDITGAGDGARFVLGFGASF